MSSHIIEKKYDNFTWVDIRLPHQKGDMEEVAQKYGLDIFQVKDSIERGHLPKFEKNGDYVFFILRAYTAKETTNITSILELSNKIAVFYNEEMFITIHSKDFAFLEDLQEKPETTEDLMLSVVRKVIESYISPAAVLSQKVDDMEATVFLKNFEQISTENIYFQKTAARIAKNVLQLMQIVVGHLEVSPKNTSSLQDIKDGLVGLTMSYDEVVENSNNLLNIYLSLSTQSNNEVVKLLTIFSAFFLPLTFIVGIYGMNFKHMPELEWKDGYYAALVLMLLVVAIIYLWFKKRKIL